MQGDACVQLRADGVAVPSGAIPRLGSSGGSSPKTSWRAGRSPRTVLRAIKVTH